MRKYRADRCTPGDHPILSLLVSTLQTTDSALSLRSLECICRGILSSGPASEHGSLWMLFFPEAARGHDKSRGCLSMNLECGS